MGKKNTITIITMTNNNNCLKASVCEHTNLAVTVGERVRARHGMKLTNANKPLHASEWRG